MAKKKNKKTEEKPSFWESISDEVKHYVLSVIFFAFSFLFFFSAFGGAGVVGEKLHSGVTFLFGVGYYITPILFLLLGISYLRSEVDRAMPLPITVGSILFVISALGFLSTLSARGVLSEGAGGLLGKGIALPMLSLFDFWVTIIFLAAIFLISIVLIFDRTPKDLFFFWKREREDDEYIDEELYDDVAVEDAEEDVDEEDEEDGEEDEEGDEEESAQKKTAAEKIKDMFSPDSAGPSMGDAYISDVEFTPPPLKLLARDSGKPNFGDIKANSMIIKRTLQNFGIRVEMGEVDVGPTVARYALKPAEGTRISRIVQLKNDLSMSLAAHPLRIEAPIPGKSLVGIEIPNSAKKTVGLGTLFAEEEFKNSPKPLLVALGKGVSGNPHFANLAKMPHLLIAGATGAGKSVTVHTLINSLLFRNPPEYLKFIMVDPKRVELSFYNKIPHLLNPVIFDAKKAIRALNWAAVEMERRYEILEAERVRDIESYHSTVYEPAMQQLKRKREKGDPEAIEKAEAEMPPRMPFIVIVIDEISDLMALHARELEASVVRLAQKSRAVGIHLILSTQRPSVNVITGLIKANIPTRIALQVTSQVDSRTILDQVGAESLLGAGDMLYLSSDMSKPVRIQSAYISEKEIKAVTKHLIDSYKHQLPDEVDLDEGMEGVYNQELASSLSVSESEDDVDERFDEAKETVITLGKASTSLLQRKMGLGYSRAAKIVDQLEEAGVIGPPNGSKPRDVYATADESGEDDYDEQDGEDVYEEDERM